MTEKTTKNYGFHGILKWKGLFASSPFPFPFTTLLPLSSLSLFPLDHFPSSLPSPPFPLKNS